MDCSMTDDYDIGIDDDFDDIDVQCGNCYRHYDPLENMDGKCPFCGSSEIVGDR